MTLVSPQVRQAVIRLNQTFQALDKVVVHRTDIFDQLKFAVMCGEHLLMIGPPGVAKSYFANSFLKSVLGAKTFKIACTKKMTEEYIVGPLDMRLFTQQGIYYHRTEGTLVGAEYAFVDEFLDLTPNVCRALLEILNERTFSRGNQLVRAPLKTCIAATNFSGDNEAALEAVLDRFLFKAKVVSLDAKQRMAMLKAAGELQPIPASDIRLIQQAVKKVVIPDSVLELYLKICSQLPKLTDRGVMHALVVIRASAVLKGRLIANVSDLAGLDRCFAITNDNASRGAAAGALRVLEGPLREHKINVVNCRLGLRMHALKSLFDEHNDGTFASVQAIVCEAREIADAVTFTGNGGLTEEAKAISRAAEEMLTKADTLYLAATHHSPK